MKKILFFFLILFSLTTAGCFGLTDSPSQEVDAKKYSIGDLMIEIPREWDVVKKEDVPSNYPETFVLGFMSAIKNERFTANGNVQKMTLPEAISSMDYARATLQSHKNTLTNFSEKNRETVRANIAGEKVETLIVTFEGKQKPETDTVRFLQTYLAKGETAYLITGAFLPNEDGLIQEKIENAVRSAELK